MLPNYLKPDSPQKQGRTQEKKAKQHINSGAVWFDPGDLTVTEGNLNYFVDVKKVVSQKSYKINLEDVEKIHSQAGTKIPMLMVYIGDYVIKGSIQRIK